jgi:phosphoribosylformylglycinamidine synthase
MKFGVVVFPGSNCDQDCVHVLQDVVGQTVVPLWHQEETLRGCDAVILPGGFSYGDYLRTGAIARFSPIMRAVNRFAHGGGLVLGICNGFQILLEAGLLPGAMQRNTGLRFICRFVTLRVERTDTLFTHRFRQGQVVRMPIAHNEGRYLPAAPGCRPSGAAQAGTADARTLRAALDQVVFRYCDADGRVTESANPNGSAEGIAGITNERGNVLGMMPHPERASEPALGSEDGRLVFESMIEALART